MEARITDPSTTSSKQIWQTKSSPFIHSRGIVRDMSRPFIDIRLPRLRFFRITVLHSRTHLPYRQDDD